MIVTVTDAVELPVSLEQAREWCRAPEDGSDDATMEVSLRGAIAYAEEFTSRVFAPKTMLELFKCWPHTRYISISRLPVRDVLAVRYVNENGIEQTVSEGAYSWEATDSGALISLESDFSVPSIHTILAHPVRVEFEAGYDTEGTAESPADPKFALPPTFLVAVRMLAAHWYENRGVVAFDAPHEVSMSAKALLSQLRIYR